MCVVGPDPQPADQRDHAVGRARESAGGPPLGPLDLVEAEQGELAGDHPGEGVQRVGDPVLVGHDRNSLERRMMLDQGTEAELQVLDQAAGPEALVVWSYDLDDSDLAGFQEVLHGRLELAPVVTAQAPRHADAGHSLRHVRQYLDHRFSFVAGPGLRSKPRLVTAWIRSR